ncbi:MAG: hypothetical protein KBT20_05220 [Bacteroidales bacterium]|nr:hypothetical protein [Candidatus Liminaster caballi]
MKKFFIVALAAMSLSLGFTSCDDDEGGNSNYSIVSNPAAEVAGDYNVTYYRHCDDLPEAGTETATSVVTIAQSETPYVVTVTFAKCADMGIDEATVNCNVAQAGNKFFVNAVGDNNAFGTSFRLIISKNKDLEGNFVKEVVVKRKRYKYEFLVSTTPVSAE